MKSPFYNTYLYFFPHDITYTKIEERLNRLGDSARVTVQEISDNERDDVIHIIDGMFTAARLRMYEEGKQKDCFVNVVKYMSDRFLAIISVYPDSVSRLQSEGLFRNLCETDTISYINVESKKENCEKYWTNYMREFSRMARYLHKDKYTLDGDDLFQINIDGVKELKKMFLEDPVRGKALLSCAFSRVACAGVRNDSVIVEDHICTGRLNRTPIRICDLTSEKPITDSVKAFRDAFTYGNISYEELASLSTINPDEYVLYSQAVLYDRMYSHIFPNTTPGKLYIFDALLLSNTPLMVVFHMDGDMAAVQYIYDRVYFKDFSTEGIHEAFCATLDKLIKNNYTVTDYKPYFEKQVSNDVKRINAISTCLKKSGWFDLYKDDELRKLAEKCRVKRLFFEQNFIEAGTDSESVFLLVHGKVEVAERDDGNRLLSLRIIKEMNFFGLEAISDNRLISEDYNVMTDDALAIILDRDLFLQEASRHNELFIKAISLQNSTLGKYKKLWLMS